MSGKQAAPFEKLDREGIRSLVRLAHHRVRGRLTPRPVPVASRFARRPAGSAPRSPRALAPSAVEWSALLLAAAVLYAFL